MSGSGQRIYLSGPISDNPNFRRMFREAKSILESQGYTDIVNPAELCEVIPNNYDYDRIMDLCMEMLAESDVLILLPGWRKSHGCGREYGFAQANDLIIMEFEDFVNGR